MKKKFKIAFISLLVIFLIFRLTIFIVLTNLVKHYQPSLIDLLSNKLGREITVKKIKVNFWGGLYLFDLAVSSLGENDPLEHFNANRLVTHLNFLNLVNPVRELRSLTVCANGGFKPPSGLSGTDRRLKSAAFSNGVKGKKDYLGAFRRISIQGGTVKLRQFEQPLTGIKGRLVITNHNFYFERLKFPLGETEFNLKGWVKDFIKNPTIDLDVEAPDFRVNDLHILFPRLKHIKFAGRGKISGHLTGQPGALNVSGRFLLNNFILSTIKVSQISSNFYFHNGCINLSPFQAKIFKGELSGSIKISELFIYPAPLQRGGVQPKIISEIKLKALHFPFGECSGKLGMSGDLFAPRVLGKIDILQGKDFLSLEKISWQFRFLSQAICCQDGEISLPKVGNILWQAELKNDLAYVLYFYLPPLRSKNLSNYVKKWPDFPGIFKAEGKITGSIDSPGFNCEGSLDWDTIGAGKTINWKIRGEKNLIKIESIHLGERLSITGSLRPNSYLLQIQASDFNPGVIPPPILEKASSRENLPSQQFRCRLKGEREGDEVKVEAEVNKENIPVSFRLNLAGRRQPSGFEGEVLIEPIVIREKKYPPLSGLIKMDSEKLVIEKLNWMGSYLAKGEVSFSPLKINLNLSLEEADITPVLAFSSTFSEGENYGLASGNIDFKGTWPEIAIKGMIELRDSKIGEKNIEYAKFQFEGISPCIMVRDSPVILDGTTLICQGPIDLRKRGKEMFKEVNYLLDEKQMIWKGWKINQQEENRELSLTKEVPGGFAVSLRTPTADKLEDDLAENSSPELELEYKIKGKEKLKLRMDEDNDYVGIEHEVKF